jgi:type I restriction enzyme S subunit
MKDPNKNRFGYKKTTVGWIPEEWDIAPLSKGISLVSGQHVDAKYCSDSPPGIPYLTGPTCFANGSVIQYTFTTSPAKMCHANDILVTVKGSGTGSVARADQIYCISRQIMAVRSQAWFQNFLYCRFVFDSKRYRYLSDGLIPGISREDILTQCIPLPPISEQKKIADILSVWENAIEQTCRLIDAKRLHKKALMQQLLLGRKRFNSVRRDEWRIRPLGELVEPASRPEPKPPKPYLSIGVRSHGKGTFQKIAEFPEKVFMDTLYRVESKDLIVNITFAWEGAIAIAKEQDTGGLVSHRFPTYRLKEKEVNTDFLSNLIQTKRFVRDLGLISPGGAGRNRVLNQKDFLKLSVSVPSIKTQTEIAKILTTADDEISFLESYLDALERQKSGLMQKLLTGEVRVKT